MGNLSAFVAYRHSGESEHVLGSLLTGVCKSLGAIGVDAYCTFFSESNFQEKQLDARQIMDHALKTIESQDFLFVVQASEAKSEGMLMEVGFCVAIRKPIVVATNKWVQNTYLPTMADLAFSYGSQQELEENIKKLDLSNLVV